MEGTEDPEAAPERKRRRFKLRQDGPDHPAVPESPAVPSLFKPNPPEPPPEPPPGPNSYAEYVVQQSGLPGTSRAPKTSVGNPPPTPIPSEPAGEPEPVMDPPEVRGADGGGGPAVLPPLPVLKPGAKSSSIVVSPRQRGNPVLKFVRNVPWEFGDIVPDYVLGQSTCALFLSLRYHHLHPGYIHQRLRGLGRSYGLQVLLLLVDVKDPHPALKELAKICVLSDCTLLLAWRGTSLSPPNPRDPTVTLGCPSPKPGDPAVPSGCAPPNLGCPPSPEEAGRYLETYKAYEQKPPDMLKEKLDQDFLSRMTDCLTSIKSVNRTDALSLLTTFGSLVAVVGASREELSLCPGVGPQKAKRLFEVLHEPFLKLPR